MNNKIKQDRKKVFKAVVQHIKTLNDVPDKTPFQNFLNQFDKGLQIALTCIKASKASQEILQQFILQFYAWSDSFFDVAKTCGLQEKVKNYDIIGKLISLLPKVKTKSAKLSFLVPIITFVKKQLQFQDKFLVQWKTQREKLRTQRFEQGINKNQSNIKEQQIQQARINEQLKIQKQKERQKQKQRQRQRQREKQKQKENKIQRIRKLRLANQSRFKKNKQIRTTNLLKFLELKKQFSYLNRDAVAKQILSNLDRFMKDKVEKILRATKIRLPGYISDEAGDEFRMYSKNSSLIQFKHSATLPDNDIKIIKVRYPSKLQRYLKLRECQEKKQQKIKNEMKQRIQTDKKVEKILQSYVLTEQKQRNLHQFQQDEGPKKKQRLVVSSQTLQYVFQNDQWFNDLFILQRTFYRGST